MQKARRNAKSASVRTRTLRMPRTRMAKRGKRLPR